MWMILESLMNFKHNIAKDGSLQLEFLLCQLLHRTPAEIRDLEKNGKLTLEQKAFLEAGIAWSLEQGMGQCPWR